MNNDNTKKNDLLIIIDLQNEFINENTNNSIADISRLVESNRFNNIIFTRFINNKDNPTYKFLNYMGCLDNESIKICIDTKEYKIIDKGTYSAYNSELLTYIKNNNIKNIYICGIDIECCVLITALNLFENNYNVYVLKDYTYCTKGISRKNKAIEILERNIGKDRVI